MQTTTTATLHRSESQLPRQMQDMNRSSIAFRGPHKTHRGVGDCAPYTHVCFCAKISCPPPSTLMYAFTHANNSNSTGRQRSSKKSVRAHTNNTSYQLDSSTRNLKKHAAGTSHGGGAKFRKERLHRRGFFMLWLPKKLSLVGDTATLCRA